MWLTNWKQARWRRPFGRLVLGSCATRMIAPGVMSPLLSLMVQRVCQWFAARYTKTCSKSSFWQQIIIIIIIIIMIILIILIILTIIIKTHQKLFSEDGLYFWRQKELKQRKLAANHFLQETQVQHIWQQINGTPPDGAAGELKPDGAFE